MEEAKLGQLVIAGKITGRRVTSHDTKQYYHVEVTTSSQYPAVFDLWTSDPTVAASNVPELAEGKDVVAKGYVNGKKQTSYKDKSGNVVAFRAPRYNVSIRLVELTPAESQQTQSQVNDDSDIPF